MVKGGDLLDNFYHQRKTTCGLFTIVGTIDSTNLIFDKNEKCWSFSLFVECKDHVREISDYRWIDLFLDNGDMIDMSVDADGTPSIIPTDTFRYLIENVGILRNQIDSAKIITIEINKLKEAKHLPPIKEFQYHQDHNRFMVQFEDSPIVFEMLLEPSIGIVKIFTFFSIGEKIDAYSGCVLESNADDVFNSLSKELMNNFIKEKIKLRFFF